MQLYRLSHSKEDQSGPGLRNAIEAAAKRAKEKLEKLFSKVQSIANPRHTSAFLAEVKLTQNLFFFILFIIL
jgi:hypothetical protein